MRVYYLAERSSVLTVNGVFLGTVDGFERTAEIDPADGVFCECTPAGYLPVRFQFNEEFLFAPPPQVKLYFSEGKVAVYCHDFLRADPTLAVIKQERVENTLLTLCMQGRLQLNFENETGFHLIALPEYLESATFCACGSGILAESAGGFCLLSREGKKLVQSEGRVLERGETLKAEIPFRDSEGHTAVCEWKGGELIACAIRSTRPPTDATLALALFESALIGADCTPYLAEELQPKADVLKEFLGDFESVVLTEDPRRVGLVYARKERVYDVRYFRVTIEDGVIANLVED